MAKMGAPTKYNVEVNQIAIDYLSDFNTAHEHAIPSVVGLAKVLNVTKSTIYNWAEEGKGDFLATLRKIEDYQHFELLNGGLTNKLNPTITKLALANHGYSEKIDNTLSDPDGGPVQVMMGVKEYKQARTEMLEEDDS